MREGFLNYWNILINEIPHELYNTALVFFVASLVLFIGLKGMEKGLKYSMGILLLEYVTLLYCSTVVYRATNKDATYNFMPLWSYRAYSDGILPDILFENFANAMVFIPVGLLLGTQIPKTFGIREQIIGYKKVQNRGWLVALVVGVGLSVGIELLQFIFRKGFAELDDVMHNTAGCLIGYGVYKVIAFTSGMFAKRGYRHEDGSQ